MFRQPSRRKYKNKGLKVRYVLLIFLVLAVFLWFIYLWMQSPVGKKVLEERNTNVSEQLQNRQERPKLGRKDLRDSRDASDRNALNNQAEEDEEEDDNEAAVDDKDRNDEDKEYEGKEDLMGEAEMLEEIENEEDTGKQQKSKENNGNPHEALYNRDELRLVKLDRQRGPETNLEKSDDEHNEGKRIVDNTANDDNHFDENDATLDSTNSEDTTQLPSNATYETVDENGSKTADLSGDGILVASTVNEKEDHISNESGLAGAGRVYATAPMEEATSVTTPNLYQNAASNIGKTPDHESLESYIELGGSMEQPSSVITEDNGELIASNTTAVKLKGELADDNNTPTTVDDKWEKSQTSEVTHQVNEPPTDLGNLPETTDM